MQIDHLLGKLYVIPRCIFSHRYYIVIGRLKYVTHWCGEQMCNFDSTVGQLMVLIGSMHGLYGINCAVRLVAQCSRLGRSYF